MSALLCSVPLCIQYTTTERGNCSNSSTSQRSGGRARTAIKSSTVLQFERCSALSSEFDRHIALQSTEYAEAAYKAGQSVQRLNVIERLEKATHSVLCRLLSACFFLLRCDSLKGAQVCLVQFHYLQHRITADSNPQRSSASTFCEEIVHLGFFSLSTKTHQPLPFVAEK